jgi:hypothetical protein
MVWSGVMYRTYHLFEMPKAEDRIVDLDRIGVGGDDVGHGDYLETGKEIQKEIQKDVVCGALFCLNGGTGGQVTTPLTK